MSRIHTTFGATSTASEVIAGIDLVGKRAIVTGASSGIGQETARALSSAGADVTLAVRNLEAGHAAAAAIVDSAGNRKVSVVELDLADRRSVRAFVDEWRGPLHILVNNAGIMAIPEQRTAEGWEMQFATNHLGHFGLTTGLHDSLAAAGDARVVNVSSVGHINGDVIFDDPNFERHPYDAWAAYSQSKTANILFAVELAKRWKAEGITANALNPGRIASTGLASHVDTTAVLPQSFDPAGTTGVSIKDIPQGAATSTLLAASPLVNGVTGKYFEDCQEAERFNPGIRRGVADYALDPYKASLLWQLSIDLLATPLSS
jgi:NAD(P)-dependent dehydrogenase (short-subunit alcohol dehydrogenase family)